MEGESRLILKSDRATSVLSDSVTEIGVLVAQDDGQRLTGRLPGPSRRRRSERGHEEAETLVEAVLAGFEPRRSKAIVASLGIALRQAGAPTVVARGLRFFRRIAVIEAVEEIAHINFERSR
jgi:hypothetical protein